MADLRMLKAVLNREHSGVLLESFEVRRSELVTRVRKAQHDASEGAIHKVRVASRRFLAILNTLEIHVPHKDTARSREIVRDCLKGLGDMRDTHVQIMATGELLRDFPQLAGFLDQLANREDRLARAARKDLQNFRVRKLYRKTNEVIDRFVDASAAENDNATRIRLARLVGKAHENVLQRRDEVDPEWPKSIHRMRIAFKRFRYTAEIAAPLFDQLAPDRLDAMQAYQTRMGKVQDVETLLRSMMAFRERSGQTSLLVPENELRRQRRARIREFMAQVDEVRFFWGATEANPSSERAEAGGELA